MPDVKLSQQFKHPCFYNSAHGQVARIHLPVAPQCQLSCAYCQRGKGKRANIPGQTKTILTPAQAVNYLKPKLKLFPTAVIGVAGPGDPLATPAALTALTTIKRLFPQNKLCLCTNGLYLAEKINALVDAGISYLSVTVNAVTPAIAAYFYQRVVYKKQLLTGVEASKLLLKKQWQGINKAVAAGLTVKLNTVFVPEINGNEVVKIAQKASRAGVKVMNLMPLIPGAKMKNLRPPTEAELKQARKVCAQYLPQFVHCQRCRADAWGLLQKSRLKDSRKYQPV